MATPPDFTAGQVLTAAQMDKIGMWTISKTAFSGATINFNNVFTSDYRNYKVLIDSFQVATATGVNLRMRKNGVDNTTANYNWSFLGQGQNGGAANYAGQNQTYSFFPLDTDATGAVWGAAEFTVFGPQLNQRTIWSGTGISYYGALGWFTYFRNGEIFHNVVDQFDGFSLYTGGPVISGNCTIYGFNNG